MKIFSNSIFLFSVLTYILVGTVPVWKCLKENNLHISIECFEPGEEEQSCCAHSNEAKQNLDSQCCEQLDYTSSPAYNTFSNQTLELEQAHLLAYLIFEDGLPAFDSSEHTHYSNAPPPRASAYPLFKLHNSYLC